jgi:AIPR protein
LTRNGYPDVDGTVEVWDLRKFAQMLEKLYGVAATLTFKAEPIQDGDALLGLLDIAGLREHVTQEELFAFNIRTFLGKRKGSVNSEIHETLQDDAERGRFWHLNNGIVCLCTEISEDSPTVFAATNFTIVNGAQTTSTIASFLDKNPAADEPVWVVAKVLRVDETDIERARELTKTSNLQTPASNKDLRAVDKTHRRIAEWLTKKIARYSQTMATCSPSATAPRCAAALAVASNVATMAPMRPLPDRRPSRSTAVRMRSRSISSTMAACRGVGTKPKTSREKSTMRDWPGGTGSGGNGMPSTGDRLRGGPSGFSPDSDSMGRSWAGAARWPREGTLIAGRSSKSQRLIRRRRSGRISANPARTSA